MEVCKVCGNSKKNKLYEIKERRINKGEIFEYLSCSRCGTLQLNEEIENISKYYGEDYTAFTVNKIGERGLIQKLAQNIRLKILIFGGKSFFRPPFLNKEDGMWLVRLCGTRLHKNSKILDIGCGAGYWLNQLISLGWKNVSGVDLHNTISPKDNLGWRFIKGDIFQIQEGQYDCITFHHSFEHMENPLEVLMHVKKLLSENGVCILAIPIMGNRAWKEYGCDWYQIDPPRHLYLYTEKAINYLCKRADMYVERVIYDSGEAQFRISEGYHKTNKSYTDLQRTWKTSDRSKKKYLEMSRDANIHREGDQAILYIKNKR